MTYRFLISLICWLSSSFFVCCTPARVLAEGPIVLEAKVVPFEEAYPEFKLTSEVVNIGGEEYLAFSSVEAKKLAKLKNAYMLLREEYQAQEKALASAERLIALQKRLDKIMGEIRDAEKELIAVHKERQKLCADEKGDLKKQLFRARVKNILMAAVAVFTVSR